MTEFGNRLLNWHETIDRELPWKATKDPYKIWVSEVILQQTQVIQGLSYYHRFTEAFPAITDLAEADEYQVMALWKGLGYYSRARNMHKAAKYICQSLNGCFPKDYDELLKLPGVGPYTAAAISSFAFDQPHAVLDGNVYRVLSRVFGIHIPVDSTDGRKTFAQLSQELLIEESPADYNQALMDFGATICKPRNPGCQECPLADICIAVDTNAVDKLPVKEKKIKRRRRHFYFFVVNKGQKYFIAKREGKDIWRGLYQFPLLETKRKRSVAAVVREMQIQWKNCKIVHEKTYPAIIKKLTHQELQVTFIMAHVSEKPELHIEVDKEELSHVPFPVVIAEFVKDNIA